MNKKLVICKDKFGKEHQIPRERLSLRIGVCGILQHENSVLLIKHTRTEKWELPGGEVEPAETLEDGLKREFLEETGIEVRNPKFLTYREDFYYIESQNAAYHSIRLFFSVKPLVDNTSTDGQFIDYRNLTAENTNDLTYSVLKELFNQESPLSNK